MSIGQFFGHAKLGKDVTRGGGGERRGTRQLTGSLLWGRGGEWTHVCGPCSHLSFSFVLVPFACNIAGLSDARNTLSFYG